MRTHNQITKSIAFVAAMLMSASVLATEVSPTLYVEGNFGGSGADTGDILDVTPVNRSGFSDEGFAWNINAIFEFYPNVAIEFGYTDLDNAKQGSTKVELDAWHAMLRGYVPLTEDKKLRLFGKAGAAFVQADGKTSAGALGTFRRDRDETSPQIGVGLMYEMPDRQWGWFNTNRIMLNTQFNYIFTQELDDIYIITGGIGLKLID